MLPLTDFLVRDPRKAVTEQLLASLSTGASSIWLSEPQNLYLAPDQANAYLDLMKDDRYAGAFHDPVKTLISQSVELLTSGIQPSAALIDLGPGYPDKTIPLFDFLKAHRIPFTYYPVDISQTFLEIATEAALEHSVAVRPIRCLFQELPPLVDEVTSDHKSRLVILGLTFMNFPPSQVLSFLTPLIGPLDRLVVATELFPARAIGSILTPYIDGTAERFNRRLLSLIGLDTDDLKYFAELNGHNIEIGFKAVGEILFAGATIRAGTRVITATSYRYAPQELVDLLIGSFRNVDLVQNDLKSVALAIVHGPRSR
jgi:uncharacterized SAM-dependent methyltransferase